MITRKLEYNLYCHIIDVTLQINETDNDKISDEFLLDGGVSNIVSLLADWLCCSDADTIYFQELIEDGFDMGENTMSPINIRARVRFPIQYFKRIS